MKRQKPLDAQRLKKENSFLITSTTVMFILFVAIVVASFRLQERLSSQSNLIQEEETPIIAEYNVADLSDGAVVMKLPAVDKIGGGVVALLSVQAQEGSGRTLVDIEGLLFFTDTQESITIAKKVASDYTKIDLSKYDLTYRIYAHADSIGGPSAGAALAIATISSLQNLDLREDVVITGRVLPDGKIGEVSSIAAKARIAKENGAKVFLVPLGQGKEKVVEQKKSCTQEGKNEVCNIENVSVEKSIEEEAGIKIVEVSTVQQALGYFLDEDVLGAEARG
ncbi:MAG TPA: hypothetical protein HA282_00410 [Nanoarchaeota archaeon]|nr:hypothetical protein [Nanoarchaeota archaeon]HIH51576.1 hypothetical protein [Nanoarchaeota archaeon]HIH65664.1 hypothetical protein [Nanoarchaeota archaeon]